MEILAEIGHALWIAFAMFWEILWPLILGFGLSGVVQAVVSKGEMSKLLPDDSPKTLAIATGLSQLPHFQNFFGAFLGVIAREAAILLDRYPKNANYSHELCALCSCRNWVYKLYRHACSSSGPPNDSRARPTSIITWWSRWRRIKDPVIG